MPTHGKGNEGPFRKATRLANSEDAAVAVLSVTLSRRTVRPTEIQHFKYIKNIFRPLPASTLSHDFTDKKRP